jgi:hypothetical protein
VQRLLPTLGTMSHPFPLPPGEGQGEGPKDAAPNQGLVLGHG